MVADKAVVGKSTKTAEGLCSKVAKGSNIKRRPHPLVWPKPNSHTLQAMPAQIFPANTAFAGNQLYL
eukprot:2135577-Rhodomonas_salina.2